MRHRSMRAYPLTSCISVLADGTRTTGFDLYEELVLHHQLSA
ncbi:hypothetical protein [Yaniella flava]